MLRFGVALIRIFHDFVDNLKLVWSTIHETKNDLAQPPNLKTCYIFVLLEDDIIGNCRWLAMPTSTSYSRVTSTLLYSLESKDVSLLW